LLKLKISNFIMMKSKLLQSLLGENYCLILRGGATISFFKNGTYFLTLCLLLSTTNTGLKAQALPPIFGSEYKAQKDNRVRQYMPAQKILWKKGNVKGAEKLLALGRGQADLAHKNYCTMISTTVEKPAILLDFGKELQGGIELVTDMPQDKNPIRLRIRLGESVTEAMSEIDTLQGATNDHAMRDFTVEVPWLGAVQIGNSGFRFARIDMLDTSRELQLKEARAIFTYRDIPYLGSFKCNDERLNQIWATGAYTVHLNMQEYLWDGIKRDRLVWVGDMHPEVMTINAVFGDQEIVRKSLDLSRDLTPLPEWMNTLSSYSMWWILIHRDLYQYQGNLAYLQEQKAYLLPLLDQLISKIKDNKEVLDGVRFLDWPSSENKKAIHAGLQALLFKTITEGAVLCDILGEKQQAEKCRKAADGLRQYIPDMAQSKQAAALLAIAGLIPAEKANKEVIAVGGSQNVSTFYGYYMLQAKAKAGDYDGALKCIREYWGGMLDMGATTFWEDFDRDWLENAAPIDALVPVGKKDIHADYGAYCYKQLRHSLCHGWASGPTSWLSEHVLGVQIVEAGCKTIRITPHLGDLTFVEGTFPTPKGVVRIKHQKLANGKIETTIKAPKGVKVLRK
jgi:alpha-L-rhamnosidase